ncbi:sugar ABC transporter permease [Paenibacillus helianthi]|uniref:Sugar ABC transporter permease n=1 Tax=Paenibacillus helianthi TaxID=1349432 RepID=A0ABX3EK72_9BACL|nr:MULTISPECIES: carbohydrate ABC transporter permease [Paenibacillus]OKP67384.1 sugar ABC transporter permease [Paenibacillus sp. P3E]OKP81577.1 sugar ABC transporter permease [Paenibacillus helianthi]OKP89250.1 sugar ABC transporter permease [Paenibacillus sp. P32E]
MRLRKGASLLITLFLSVGALISFFPIYLAIINSVKTQGEMFSSFLALPTKLHFENYSQAFDKINLLHSTLNSVIVSVIGIGGIIFCAALAGYKLSRTSGRLSAAIFSLFIASMLVPFHSIMIPLTRMAKALHVSGSTYGLALIYIGLGVNMAIFLYHGFVKSIPRELEEAARIDGCGEFQTFFRIIFPLLLPITVTIAILDFLWIWNDFLLPLLMLTDSNKYTLILSTNTLFGEYNKEWSLILAALVLTALPVIVIYGFFQKFIMQGIAEGAIKG